METENDNDDGHPHSIFGGASYRGVYQIIDTIWMGVDEEPSQIKLNIFYDGHCFFNNGDLFISGGQYQTLHNLVLL